MRREAIAAMLVVGAALDVRAQSLTIEHSGVSCVVADRYPHLEAQLRPADGVGRARIHFRPEGGSHWYSVPLKPEGTGFGGILPKPRKQLQAFDYYIEAADTALGTARTQEYRTAVESGATACKDRLVAGGLATAAGVTVSAPTGAVGLPLVPVGFSSEGVVAGAGTAASAGAAGSPPGGGGGTTTAAVGGGGAGMSGMTLGLLIGGAAVAVGGVVALAGGGGDTSSDSEVGGSAPGRGDNPPTCTPGPITSSLANPPTALRCGQPATLGVVLRNGSCSPLAVSSVQLNHASPVSPGCQGAQANFAYPPAVATLAAGQTATVLNFQSAPHCCTNGPCTTTGTCTFNETFSVLTSAGAVPSGTASFQVSYDPSCPVCP